MYDLKDMIKNNASDEDINDYLKKNELEDVVG